MFSKINISDIVRDHLKTLKNYQEVTYCLSDFVLFFGVPLILAVALCLFGVYIDSDSANPLITIMSIFAALLFNLLILIVDILKKDKARHQAGAMPSEANGFLRQVFSNISFCILIAIIDVVCLAITSFSDKKSEIINAVGSFFSYYFISLFMLTLFMVLKRIHNMLVVEFRGE